MATDDIFNAPLNDGEGRRATFGAGLVRDQPSAIEVVRANAAASALAPSQPNTASESFMNALIAQRRAIEAGEAQDASDAASIDGALDELADANASVDGALGTLAAAVEATKADLATVSAALSDKQNERRNLLSATPHADDIVAAFSRGLNTASANFVAQLGRFLNDRNAIGDQAVQATSRREGAQLLRFPALDGNSTNALFPNGSSMDGEAVLSANALAYFLRDLIGERLPELVARLVPSAATGMRDADRQAALAIVDDEIATLTARRNELEGKLLAARKGVR